MDTRSHKIDRAIELLMEVASEVSSSRSGGDAHLHERHRAADELDDLATCFNEAMHKMHGILSTRRQRYNSSAPVYRLPPEIMSDIFLSTIQNMLLYGTPYIPTLHRLATISKEWSRLINESPCLWKSVSSNQHLSIVKQVLQRSREAPLDVKFESANDIIEAIVFTEHMIEHVHRWRSVVLTERSQSSDTFQSLITVPAPKLEKLEVDCHMHTRRRRRVIDIFGGEADRLLHVKLVRFCIPWKSGMLSGLESLELGDLGEMGPTGQQILSMLAASPRLVSLNLFDLTSSAEADVTLSAPVELPRLTRIVVTRLSPQLARMVLVAIRTPRCLRLQVHVLQQPSDIPGLLTDPLMAEITSHIKRLVSLSTSTTVECDGRFIVVQSEYRRQCCMWLTFDVDEQWEFGIPEGLRDVLDQAGGVVTFAVSYRCSIPGIIPLLRSTCDISSLNVTQMEEPMTTALMDFLAEQVNVEGRMMWPIPGLTELTFREVELDSEVFIQAISRRYGEQESVEESGSSANDLEPYKPLRLSMGGVQLDSQDVHRLEEILGSSNVDYRSPAISDVDDMDLESTWGDD